ncbi:MAG TPA: D-Ala-D-Ala carboxypeptidase family metallohydrolase [Pyrinomonadaceae bacterium]
MPKLVLSFFLLVAAQPVVFSKQPTRVAKRDVMSTQVEEKFSTSAKSKRKISQPRSVVTFPSGASLPIAPSEIRSRRADYDPNHSGNPLLITSGKYRNIKLSTNFTVGEYARSGGVQFDVSRIDPEHVRCLQQIRNAVGRPVWIDSGYRSFVYNNELYKRRGEKPTRSQHISGRGTDIRIGNMTGLEIAEAAIDACGPDIGIGIGPRYAHIDGRGHFAIWKYKGSNASQVAAVKQYRQSSHLAQNRSSRVSAKRVRA